MLIRADALRVGRDPLLALLATLPLALAAAVRVVAPAGFEWLPATVDDVAVASGVMAVLLLLTPMMFGFVIGLVLLDERDEGVLTAVALTPVGTTGFLGYRMATPVVWSSVATVLVVLLAGLVPFAPARLAVLALLAGLQAPLLALFLGAFAADKVRGMALAKAGSVLIGIGAVAAIAPDPWRWLAAPSPHFWLVRLAIGEGPLAQAMSGATFWLEVAAAVVVHLGVLWALARLLRARAG
jgi:fluoroquinolone transport system permease protein